MLDSCDTQDKNILKRLLKIFRLLMNEKKQKFERVLPFGDYFIDRHEKADFLGFGKGSSVYDNVIILGNVTVGKNTWIGPNVILDGSGGLEIGSNCSISAGVQIYSHDSVQWAISGGKRSYEYASTRVEDNCYIAPNVIIQKGISIEKGSIIGANSFVNKNIPMNSKAYGTPVKIYSRNE